MGDAMAKGGNRRIDRILDPSYVEGIADAPIEALRAKRAECEEEEGVVSYERGLIHSRLKILKAEEERRVSGAPARSLIDRLPEILADENRTHRGSFPKLDAPQLHDHPRRRVEKLVTNDTLARLPELSDDEISRAIAALDEAEREVSEIRNDLLAVLNPLIEEIGRRVGADV